MRAENVGPAENKRNNERMQDQRPKEVAAELFIGAGVTAVLDLGGYGRVLTFGSAG